MREREREAVREVHAKFQFENLGEVGMITMQEVLGRTNRLFSLHRMFSISYDTDRIENTESNTFSIAACVFVTAGKFLRCLTTLRGGHTHSEVLS
jgi:hypothetical protein